MPRFIKVALVLAAIAAGTQGVQAENAKIRIAYRGEPGEILLFAGRENGFFQKRGLDVELVRENWSHFISDTPANAADGIQADIRDLKTLPAEGGPGAVFSFYSAESGSRPYLVLRREFIAKRAPEAVKLILALSDTLDWVAFNPRTAGELGVRKGYILATASDAGAAIGDIQWSVSYAAVYEDIRDAFPERKIPELPRDKKTPAGIAGLLFEVPGARNAGIYSCH
jgi:ABC-type nitrate/sulfonate/bicarbonate transport system substrate-binding protein